MAMVVEAFISASVEILLDRITSGEFRDFFAKTELNVSLQSELKTKLLALSAVLNDAEEKQITNDQVKKWVDELKDAVLDAEDLLDEINTEFLRRKVEGDSQNRATKVRSSFSSLLNPFNSLMNSKLKEISQKLEYFVQQKIILGLESVAGRALRRRETGSWVTESDVVAREDDKEKLLKLLLTGDGDDNTNNIGVIVILGMGGLGKTTLAQLLYKHCKKEKQFDLTAWNCVSGDFDVFRVTKNIYESVTSEVYNGDNLHNLREKLENSLKDRKFLLVLDDLWNEKYSDWDDLITPFRSGKMGSKIIVTTRHRGVADVARTFPTYELKPLSDESCWRILANHALVNEGSDNYRILEDIGREIARKCGGLPLAAKTLAGALRSKADAGVWDGILKTNIWDLKHDDVLPALRISYLYLPSHLKRCFAYCSIFPKQYPLDRKKLILLWMAEGFLQQSDGEKPMELAGEECFDELLSSSLIQCRADGEGGFVMHDLIHDLATLVSGKSCCCFEGDEIPKNVRHLSFSSGRYDGSKKFKSFHDLKCLRTFLQRGDLGYGHSYLNREVPHDLLSTLKCLRVLSLSGYRNITELPNSIGKLVHLRHLDLSYTSLKSLPDAAFTLYNMQTLILKNCRSLSQLPEQIENLVHLRHLDLRGTNLVEMPTQIGNLVNSGHLDVSHTKLEEMPTQIGNLVNLRHLDVSDTKLVEMPTQIGNLVNLRHLDVSDTNLVEMPTQISQLQNLRTLTAFVVGRQDAGLRIRQLRKFPYLQGKLSILKLQNVVDPVDASEANLKNKEEIEELVLEWDRDSDTQDSQIVRDVLDKLQPSTKLRKLRIRYYGGTNFPNWMGDSSFSNIVSLRISGCNNCWSLPPFGQLPSLKELLISGMKMVQIIGQEFYGSNGNVGPSSFQPFPSLETLEFREMSNWQKWVPFEGEEEKNFPFACLKRLCLSTCPKLSGNLPTGLPSLEKVEIWECNQLGKKSSDPHWSTSIEELHITGGGAAVLLSLLENNACCQISIDRIDRLQSLPRMILGGNCLQKLCLSNIASSISFPVDGLRTSLRSLQIQYCKKLEFLSHETWHKYTSLEGQEIRGSCQSLTSFPLGCFPALRNLVICGCPNLESITQVGGSTSNLVSCTVIRCDKLKSLPEQMDLTALEFLELGGLPDLASLPPSGLPSNLKLLAVDCRILSCMAKPELGFQFQHLTSLSALDVLGNTYYDSDIWGYVDGGGDVVNTLLKEPLLPTSLTSLGLADLGTTKLLEGKGLQLLTSLKRLVIWNCPMLESLPEDQLPSSLELLRIGECPLLEARYQRSQKGKHWSKIAHIPAIEINEEVIVT